MRTVVWVAVLLAAVGGAASAGSKCGGVGGIKCSGSEYCDLKGACGAKDLEGECFAVGGVCTDQDDPVCGCDGQTYTNDCHRRHAKVQKRQSGQCPTAGGTPNPVHTAISPAIEVYGTDDCPAGTAGNSEWKGRTFWGIPGCWLGKAKPVPLQGAPEPVAAGLCAICTFKTSP
jgi:hypothetical protein